MQSPITFSELFTQLPRGFSGNETSFIGMRIPGIAGFHIAVGRNGAANIMVETTGMNALLVLPDIRRVGVEISHGRRCIIEDRDHGSTSGIFTIFSCGSDETSLIRYFFDCLEGPVRRLENSSDVDLLQSFIIGMIELFSAIDITPTKTVQGLWAEMLLIAHGVDPYQLGNSWHSGIGGTYDFDQGDQRIEVKSTSTRTRRHRFRIAQLNPPPGSELIIASVRAIRSQGGENCLDLLAIIRSRLVGQRDVLDRVERTVRQVLGSGYAGAFDVRFDLQEALASVRLYHQHDVPTISADHVPPDVSSVEFEVDLANVDESSSIELEGSGGIFSAVLPATS
jgi:hypothetical protein